MHNATTTRQYHTAYKMFFNVTLQVMPEIAQQYWAHFPHNKLRKGQLAECKHARNYYLPRYFQTSS